MSDVGIVGKARVLGSTQRSAFVDRPDGASWAQALLASRRNVSPRRLDAPGPDTMQLLSLMQAAATAPDHGLLTPWHFVLVPASARAALANAFVSALVERDPGATQVQLEAAAEKAHRAPCLLLAVAHVDDGSSGISMTERLVSLGCAIQNVLLSATAEGLGSGLTSGRSLKSDALRTLFDLRSDEEAICFIAIGTSGPLKPPRHRPDAAGLLRTLIA
ncbi:MAG: nitroreductase [Proteobacteria bacterium]|nr:MAG: nitroreductase [Pseudomonadota bacterium]